MASMVLLPNYEACVFQRRFSTRPALRAMRNIFAAGALALATHVFLEHYEDFRWYVPFVELDSRITQSAIPSYETRTLASQSIRYL